MTYTPDTERGMKVAKGIALVGGVEIEPGHALHDGRGEAWSYVSVTRLPEGNSTGRIFVERECGHVKEDGDCEGAYWCQGMERREFFPSVFPDVEIKPEG